MSARLVVLGLVAAAVVIAGVYLFIEVRSTPAVAAVLPSRPATSGESPPEAEDHAAPDRRARPTNGRADRIAGAAPPVSPETSGAPGGPGAPGSSDEPSSEETAAALDRPNPKIDAIMDQANKHYDKGEWEDAKLIAVKVLAKQPTNVRMMRIMVSASCVDGDVGVAQKWFDQLPKPDREQMKVRCERYAVTFKEPAQ